MKAVGPATPSVSNAFHCSWSSGPAPLRALDLVVVSVMALRARFLYFLLPESGSFPEIAEERGGQV